MLLDLLLFLLLLLLFAAALFTLAVAWLTLPTSDLFNRLLRRVGLAGPAQGSRLPGMRDFGEVATPFTERGGVAVGKVRVHGELWNARCPVILAARLGDGDAVEIAYNDDLTVTVLGPRSHRALDEDS